MERTLGILGGMGPEAGCFFYREFVHCTAVDRDQDHPKAILYSQTKIPDRTAYLEGRGESPVPSLVEAVCRLEEWGAEFIAIPCNTAHFFWREMQSSVGIPILHIVETTAEAIVRAADGHRPEAVGILGTRSTVRGGLYQKVLERRGIRSLVPASDSLDDVHECIERLKSGRNLESAAGLLQPAMEALCKAGAQVLVFGCTELGLLDEFISPPCPVVDSVIALAGVSAEMASGTRPLPQAAPAA